MSFVLNANIKVGTVSFTAVHHVRTRRGVHSYVDTAIIEVPTTARLKKADAQTRSEETAQVFHRGDAVTIQLGYNGEYKEEFKGFVNRIDYSTPCVIECEGYSYQLKKKNINKSWKSTTLRSLCEEIVKGTDIKVHAAVGNMKIQNLRVKNSPATKVLDHLKRKLHQSVYFVNGNELYVGLEEIAVTGSVKYRMGWNVIKDGGLKYKQAEDKRIKIVLKTAKSEGGKDVYSAGDSDGEVREFLVHNVSKNELKQIAEAKLAKVKYTGYDGKMNAFLQPFAVHGMSAELTDKKYPERDGTYYVDSTEVMYGMTGARRIVEISKKISS